MPRRQYQESLDDLRSDVRAMGELVLERLDRSLLALEGDDPALAEAVVEGDEEINERYLALESDCIDLFALQQPVAGDLRLIAASFKIITDLERVGDLAANLAGYALEAGEANASGPSSPGVGTAVDPEVAAIGADARTLVADALEAYVEEDAAACRSIAARDDEIDALCASASDGVVRDLVEREASDDPWSVERLLDDVSRTLLTIRDVERIADHGVNIAARTLYMVESDPALIY